MELTKVVTVVRTGKATTLTTTEHLLVVIQSIYYKDVLTKKQARELTGVVEVVLAE